MMLNQILASRIFCKAWKRIVNKAGFGCHFGAMECGFWERDAFQGGGFKHFLFSPLLGEDSHFD